MTNVSNKHLPTEEEMLEMFSDVEIRCLDIETTGFSRTNDYVIELGMVFLNCGKVVKEGDVLFGGGQSSSQSLKIHGITDESRAGKKTFAQRSKYFKQVIESTAKNADGKDIPVIYVGHNSNKFDIPFLVHKCREAGHPIINKEGSIYTVDTAKIARKHLSSPDFKLRTLCEVYELEYGAHRALGDAKSTLNLLCVCMKKGGFKHVLDIAEKLGI